MTIRLVVADDHQLFLSGLTSLLAGAEGMEVVATAHNGIQAIAVIKRHQPDVALLDLTMPGANGFEVFSEVRRWSPDTACVVLTGTIQPTLLDELDRAGAAGLMLKSAPRKS
ncbi:response regulator transcription factor [Rhodobacteraceae bacterium D3-12]|nr:response regulator transcription factor [Rhodobacteraceae bacterium D3-12]